MGTDSWGRRSFSRSREGATTVVGAATWAMGLCTVEESLVTGAFGASTNASGTFSRSSCGSGVRMGLWVGSTVHQAVHPVADQQAGSNCALLPDGGEACL